jgi:STE24 endopeptidase
MISALKRLAADNLSNLYPHPLYVWFHYSHPPIVERAAGLEEASAALGGADV